MENEMIERVARAILQKLQEAPHGLDAVQRASLSSFIARAAIEAMREPTEAMKEASGCDYDSCDNHMNDLLNAWNRMIDAALGKVDA